MLFELLFLEEKSAAPFRFLKSNKLWLLREWEAEVKMSQAENVVLSFAF